MGRIYVCGQGAVVPAGALVVHTTPTQEEDRDKATDVLHTDGVFAYRAPNMKVYCNMDAFFRSAAVHAGVKRRESREYWTKLRRPNRARPSWSQTPVLYYKFKGVAGGRSRKHHRMQAKEARLSVMIPLYHAKVAQHRVAGEIKEKLRTADVYLVDRNGPRNKEGKPLRRLFGRALFKRAVACRGKPLSTAIMLASYLADIKVHNSNTT